MVRIGIYDVFGGGGGYWLIENGVFDDHDGYFMVCMWYLLIKI